MKVLCFTESLAAGGAQRQLVNLAITLKSRNEDVIFAVYRHEDFFLNELQRNNIPVYYISNKNYVDRMLASRHLFKGLKPNVIISFLETPNFIAEFSTLGKHHWKLITTELSAKNETFSGMKNKIFLKFQKLSDVIVCNSINAEKKWRENCPQYSDKIMTIYNPILISQYNEDVKCRHNNMRNIIVPASYQYLKNPIRLIEAYHLLPTDVQNQIEINWYGKKEPRIGDTQAYDEANALVKKYELIDKIHLHPETKDIYQEMEKADAVGLFSTVEGLPNAICEGMMLGKPIIMSRVSDFNFLSSSNGVLLCNPLSTASISDALDRFAKIKQDELDKMGKLNQEFALRNFSGKVIGDQWMKLISEITA